MSIFFLKQTDPEIAKLIRQEVVRQEEGLEMIASENIASPEVLEALGTPLTDKYSEGYPGRRYYGGNALIDAIESLAIERAKKLFAYEGCDADHANVQSHSGSDANLAAYLALMNPGDTFLGMQLTAGGHLTHGHKVSATGRIFRAVQYGVRRSDERIDYDEVRDLARRHKPKVIVCGATAYPRVIDFAQFAAIAREVQAVLVADLSHIAGLVVAGVHPHAFPHADVITTTTHKTLRGPRGAMILCKTPYAQAIDKSVMPGLQGGPLDHVIAAKAVAFGQALQPAFRNYASQIVKNAQVLARVFASAELQLVTGGTDNHLVLVDVTPLGISGKIAEQVLERAGIFVNKNTVPFDVRKPMDPSGIRVGTPVLTSRGMKEDALEKVAELIIHVLKHVHDSAIITQVKHEVRELTKQYPARPWF